MDTILSQRGLFLELHRAEIAEGRMAPPGIVEALDVVEHVGLGLVARAVFRAVLSVSSEEKKLSIAALSQTLPERLIEQATPLSAISRWNCSLVYWLPRSE